MSIDFTGIDPKPNADGSRLIPIRLARRTDYLEYLVRFFEQLRDVENSEEDDELIIGQRRAEKLACAMHHILLAFTELDDLVCVKTEKVFQLKPELVKALGLVEVKA